MNISDVKATGTLRTDLPKSKEITNSESLEQFTRDASVSKQDYRDEDRVELSAEARAALAEGRASEELSHARLALENLPELTEERVSQLTDRIKNGYYLRDDIQAQLSQFVGNELRKEI